MSSFRSRYTIKRRQPGQYVKGRWIEGAADALEILASVQPMNIQEVQSLPEGRRSGKAYKLYTDTELYEVNQETDTQTARSPDLIVINGKDFEIIKVLPYQSGIINHYKCYAVEVPE